MFQISKGNSQYHKIFKEISKEEQLIQSESVTITHPKCCMREKTRPKNLNYTLILLFWSVCSVKQSAHSYNVQLISFFPPVHQVTPVLCRKTSSTKDGCLSPTTGSASTPKCLAKTPRYWCSHVYVSTSAESNAPCCEMWKLLPTWWCYFGSDRHSRDVGRSDQEDQNRHSGAKCSGDRNCKW